MAERNFQRIESDFVQFKEIGDYVEGELESISSQTFRRSDQVTDVGKYTVVTDEGERKTFLGGTEIDQKLAGIEVGTYIRVTYQGNIKTGQGQSMKSFLVEVAT